MEPAGPRWVCGDCGWLGPIDAEAVVGHRCEAGCFVSYEAPRRDVFARHLSSRVVLLGDGDHLEAEREGFSGMSWAEFCAEAFPNVPLDSRVTRIEFEREDPIEKAPEVRDPFRPKLRHMADKIRADGAVAALCFRRPQPINLKRTTWTNRREAVTCPKCLRLMAGPTGVAQNSEPLRALEADARPGVRRAASPVSDSAVGPVGTGSTEQHQERRLSVLAT